MTKVQIDTTTTSETTVLHDETHLSELKSMSSKIRYLSTIYTTPEGSKFPEDRGRIAKILGIKYQWVRNVLNTPLKK